MPAPHASGLQGPEQGANNKTEKRLQSGNPRKLANKDEDKGYESSQTL